MNQLSGIETIRYNHVKSLFKGLSYEEVCKLYAETVGIYLALPFGDPAFEMFYYNNKHLLELMSFMYRIEYQTTDMPYCIVDTRHSQDCQETAQVIAMLTGYTALSNEEISHVLRCSASTAFVVLKKTSDSIHSQLLSELKTARLSYEMVPVEAIELVK